MEGEIEIASNNIPSYKVEGYITLFYAIYCFIMFIVFFYGAKIPSLSFFILHWCTITVFMYCSFKLFLIFKNILGLKLNATIIFIYLILVLTSNIINSIPFIYYKLFQDKIFYEDLTLKANMANYYSITKMATAVVMAVRGILYLFYRKWMKNTIRFWGWLDISYATILFIGTKQAAYIDLLAALGSLSVSYFFFNFKDEIKNLELKNTSAISDPEILDQI